MQGASILFYVCNPPVRGVFSVYVYNNNLLVSIKKIYFHFGKNEQLEPLWARELNVGSFNGFDKLIRALDLVGQINISMAPCTTTVWILLQSPLDLPINSKTYYVEDQAELQSLA